MKPRTGPWLPWHVDATRPRARSLVGAARGIRSGRGADGDEHRHHAHTPCHDRDSYDDRRAVRPTTTALPGLAPGTRLAVKIDNTVASRPRVGLDHAAVVYVEPVTVG